jgi:hypothetical protein
VRVPGRQSSVLRRCGFDLFGRPADSAGCPECGSDLTVPRAIVIGQRRRHRQPIVPGALLTLVPMALLGAIAAQQSGKFNRLKYEPTWLLVRQAVDKAPGTADDATTELLSRMAAGQLTQAQVDAIVDRFLALQADISRTWVSRWGDFIEQVKIDGELGDNRWRRYALQNVHPTLLVRPQVRRGDPLPVRVLIANGRVGQRLHLVAGCKIASISVGGHTIPQLNSGEIGFSISPGSTGSGGADVDLSPILPPLADGIQPVIAQLDMQLLLSVKNPETPIAHSNETLADQSVTLLPADQETVTVRHDDSLRPAIEQAIKVLHISRNGTNLNFTVDTTNVPIRLSYEVVIRTAAGREFKAGSLTRTAGAAMHSFGMYAADASAVRDGDHVDVVLRPSTQPTVRSTDVTEVSDGEVVIMDVPVGRTKQ